MDADTIVAIVNAVVAAVGVVMPLVQGLFQKP
jgi:hypothetical protein